MGVYEKGLLSERMEMIVGLAQPVGTIADIGCDHGFVSIELARRGIAEKVIASDVKDGPLEHARSNIERSGVPGKIEIRKADGLDGLSAGQVDACIIAGMGGNLMIDIIEKNLEFAQSLSYMVLSPQSDISKFRLFLNQNGFKIVRNEICKEDGKYYFAMRVVPMPGTLLTTSQLGLLYGDDLLLEDRGLYEYLEWERANLRKIRHDVSMSEGEHKERLEEIDDSLKRNESAMQMVLMFRTMFAGLV